MTTSSIPVKGKNKASASLKSLKSRKTLPRSEGDLTEKTLAALTEENAVEKLNEELCNKPYMQGITDDWDVKPIFLKALKELCSVSTIPYQQRFDVVFDSLVFYDKKLISVENTIPAPKRLAYFLSKLITRMLENDLYREKFYAEALDCDPNADRAAVRGLLLKRLATPEALAVCGRYFRPEILRAELYTQRIAERKRIMAESNALITMLRPART